MDAMKAADGVIDIESEEYKVKLKKTYKYFKYSIFIINNN